jgi:Protein of unknown function (DUF3224)
MTMLRGTFDVTMQAEPPLFEGDGVVIARATFHKTFHGELSARGVVHFTSVRAGEHAAYVALERIEGSVSGRAGSFVVSHKAQASSGDKTLAIEVVPGTGTGELVGIAGTIDIAVREGVHHYAFEYTLP